jgi:hypothetical protein
MPFQTNLTPTVKWLRFRRRQTTNKKIQIVKPKSNLIGIIPRALINE